MACTSVSGLFLEAATLSLFLTAAAAPVSAELVPQRLRVEYLSNPLGLTERRPRLSWTLESPEREQRQSAYRVQVAGSPERLEAGQPDLWDSGRVDSDQSLHVEYDGVPLGSGMECFWRVRVWDRDDQASEWTPASSWSMGVLEPGDWIAEWITHPDAPARTTSRGHNGYHSALADEAESAKWVVVDLGEVRGIDSLRLFPARPFDWRDDVPGFLYPLRFRVDVARDPSFAESVTVVDHTADDTPESGMEPQTYRFANVDARYARLWVSRLRMRDAGVYAFALAELQVLADDEVLSTGAPVTALDSIEMSHWSTINLTDGVLEPRRPGTTLSPALSLRREFVIHGRVRRALVHATALGLYELRINGARVGDQVLAPGWTDYGRKVQVQTFDVTDHLRPGPNTVAVWLGDGWYAGRIGLAPPPGRHLYGTHPEFLGQIAVTLEDGGRQVVGSDSSWRATEEGPIRYSDILDGEVYDASRELHGWDLPGFDDSDWVPVSVRGIDARLLVGQPNEPIRVTKELPALALTEPVPGVYVFDLGQNMVGWVRADLRGEVGDEVVLQYAERLNPDGTVYTANLRGAPQRDVCILGRTEVTRFEPHFTYHGFRYVQVTGLAVPPVQGDVVGRVFHNAAPKVGTFDSDSPLLNQLMHNVEWVQRGNMHSSPTDCPQRDERLGWMGDIQAFSQTAAFNMDMAAFLTKWLADVRDAQLGDGRFPDFAPQPFAAERFHGTPAWGDAAVFVPWKMWVNYGDRRLLEKHFDAMLAWNEYVLAGNPDMLWTRGRGNDYGDWLNGDTLLLEGYPHGTNEVPKDVMATAFWKRSTELLARIAGVLGHAELEESLALRAEAIRSAFREAYVDADGRIAGDTQAGYALALRFGMLEGTAADRALEHLVAAIRAYRDHPSTGIQSTHRMLIELSERGLHQEAGRLVMLEDVPSWGYMVRMGATTIWERWDGFVEGRGFQNPGMNSFNHWALGSVGEWVWRTLVGINPDPEHPAYRHVEIRPRPLPGLTRVDGEHLSVRGPVRVAWELGAGEFRLDIQLPPGTEGTVVVPCRDPNRVTESGLGIEEAEGIESLPAREPGTACFAVGSGSYRLIVPQ